MTIARICVIALIAAIVIVATTAITTIPTPAAAQQQEQFPIYIIKDGTNSYSISSSASFVGSFDTTYRIAGERSAIMSAENLIISTITEDFKASRTIGYVMVGNTSNTTTTAASTGSVTATLPSPFASPEQITERITNELRRGITEAENNSSQGQHVEIKCDFGMSLEDMQCHYGPLPQSG